MYCVSMLQYTLVITYLDIVIQPGVLEKRPKSVIPPIPAWCPDNLMFTDCVGIYYLRPFITSTWSSSALSQQVFLLMVSIIVVIALILKTEHVVWEIYSCALAPVTSLSFPIPRSLMDILRLGFHGKVGTPVPDEYCGMSRRLKWGSDGYNV